MEFFVPKADPEEAEQMWQATRERLLANGYRASERRVYEINYEHNGAGVVATVGGQEPLTRGLILMIFEGPTFLICTPYRGALWEREVPVLAGVPKRIFDFDST